MAKTLTDDLVVRSEGEQTLAPVESDSQSKSDSSSTAPRSLKVERHEIEQLAYSYWLDRQCNGHGGSGEESAEEDWLRAERALHQSDSAEV